MLIAISCIRESWWHDNDFPISCALDSQLSIGLTEFVELLIGHLQSEEN